MMSEKLLRRMSSAPQAFDGEEALGRQPAVIAAPAF
jgi:hypothetical protein